MKQTTQLASLVEEVKSLHTKLILLIGNSRSGKTALLDAYGKNENVTPLRLGAELGSKLATIPQRRRQLQTPSILRALADQYSQESPLLLDNIELLFDKTLQLDPLSLLKQHAHERPVIAAWPGQLAEGQLTYATLGHPEHQSYSPAGVVTFDIE